MQQTRHRKVETIGKGTGAPMVLQTLGNKNLSSDLIKSVQRFALNEIKKNREYIISIEDMQAYAYPGIYKPSSPGFIRKDAPLMTTTTGAWNAVFGAIAWEWVNQEANLVGALEKVPWTQSGWRIVTAAGITSGGGQAEGSVVPNTVMPTLATVSKKPAIVATGFNVSALEQELGVNANDDMFDDPIAWLRQYTGREHVKLMNRHALTDLDTLAGDNLESIDRIIASQAEISGGHGGSGDGDIYGLDRDGTAINDAYVLHNSGTDREVTLAHLDDIYQSTIKFDDSRSDRRFWLTGPDTYMRLAQLIAPRQQYIPGMTKWWRPNVNGIETFGEGVDGGIQCVSYQGYPFVISDDVPKDTISRVYFVNSEYLKMKMLLPTQYYQTGLTTDGNPFGINFIGDEGLYLTMGEYIATRFNVHGKGMDFK